MTMPGDEDLQLTLDTADMIVRALLQAAARSSDVHGMDRALRHAGLKLIEEAVGPDNMVAVLRDAADVLEQETAKRRSLH